MITLTLLHPVQSTPVQSWRFEHDSVIRIGRAVDNHVVLYSAVVSRYHVEVRLSDQQWEVVNLGTNGTYVDGKRVHQTPLETGNILRLARSGPNIKVVIGDSELSDDQNDSAAKESVQDNSLLEAARAKNGISSRPENSNEQAASTPEGTPSADLSFQVKGRYSLFEEDPNVPSVQPCDHHGVAEDALICTDCGQPIQPIQYVGPFQGLKRLSQSGNTIMAWRGGHTVVLKTLPSDYLRDAELVRQFEAQARQLCALEHPGMPKMFEAFEAQGQPYLVSEMIYGPSLKDWVADHGSVPQYQALQWMLELSELLNCLHQQTPPYVHQAISPANIIRPKVAHGSSQVVLVGFGKVAGLAPSSGTLPGTGVYSDPEQQMGVHSAMTDLYALGATLVYLLTGQDPDTFYRVGDESFQLQVKDQPSLSPKVVEIIQRLTHPQSDHRFESAAAVIEALQSLL